jgi:hypothetical protein
MLSLCQRVALGSGNDCTYVKPDGSEAAAMLTLIFGIFAFFWATLFTAVGLTVLFAFVVPLLLIALFFRLGLFLMKLVAGVFLLSLVAVCLF